MTLKSFSLLRKPLNTSERNIYPTFWRTLLLAKQGEMCVECLIINDIISNDLIFYNKYSYYFVINLNPEFY